MRDTGILTFWMDASSSDAQGTGSDGLSLLTAASAANPHTVLPVPTPSSTTSHAIPSETHRLKDYFGIRNPFLPDTDPYPSLPSPAI